MFFLLEPLERRRLLSTAGQLDTSFGDGGVFVDASVTVPDTVKADGTVVRGSPADRIAIDGAGNVLVAGHDGNDTPYLGRYTAAGVPESSFNGSGREAIASALDKP